MNWLIAIGCFALGLVTAWVSVAGTRAYVRLVSGEGTPPGLGRTMMIVLFVLKLPLLCGAVWLATRPGPWGWGPFLVGAAVVYFLTVGKSVKRLEKTDATQV
ncbi:MAG: hypothetical protein KIT11_04080 [Fimbriimonadaceae bacterium]|nr:hypothetical protein [Fimbriimonadaceae bacterium]QYK56925.1 MAG: hypothetical protein KF733_05445 [Fimbriimonadaceae bacterium]